MNKTKQPIHPVGAPGHFHYSTNFIDRCPHLSFQEKGLYNYLIGMRPGYQFSSERIAGDTKESAQTIQKILRRLESLNLIKRTKLNSGRMIMIFPEFDLTLVSNEEAIENIPPNPTSFAGRQAAHRKYLLSNRWKQFRKQAIQFYGPICNRCGEPGYDVHHKTYENWGRETLMDVEILCRACHSKEHGKQP